ncbi:MAG: PEP-CTERM sorting domain-containing protein [Planctomycetaceae bacterium]|nr:PEP-CTERM sorting domain-containing protein [Planctomycetaceae bacterium]
MSVGSKVFSLAIVAVLLFVVAVPVKAEVVLLGSETIGADSLAASGTWSGTFGSSLVWDEDEDSYTGNVGDYGDFVLNFNFSLQDANAMFTSFRVNLDPIFEVASQVYRHGAGSMSFDNPYEANIKWGAELLINGQLYENYSNIANSYDLYYEPEEIPRYASARSQVVYHSDPSIGEISFDADTLALYNVGSNLVFSLVFSGISISVDGLPVNNIAPSSISSVTGDVEVSWNSAPSVTPEPASMLIVGIGLAGAGAVAYRRRRAKK